MRVSKLIKLLFVVSLLALSSAGASAQTAVKNDWSVPDKIGDFRARGRTALPISLPNASDRQFRPDDFAVTSEDSRNYVGPDGKNFFVRVVNTASSSASYSLLRHLGGGEKPRRVEMLEGLGVLGIAEQNRVRFIKGGSFVDVRAVSERAKEPETLRAFVKLFADALEGEAGHTPVLVLHLPEWEKKVNEELGFAVSLPALQQAAGNRPALDAVPFDGGAEAVTTTYGDARLVIVEFSTPQHAFDADAAINARIAQLRAGAQPVPTLYKRVGNYSVFVFDATDAAAAEQLASGVKYEKDVRWLGRNPHADEIAARHYTRTMGGVILTTLITTGVAILLCLGVGGLIGGFIFLRRRSEAARQEVYSDAGGMMRLNLEDLNAPHGRAELLARGEE